MATAAAYYRSGQEEIVSVGVAVPLGADLAKHYKGVSVRSSGWKEALDGTAELDIPDPRMRFLFESAKRTLTLLSAASRSVIRWARKPWAQ